MKQAMSLLAAVLMTGCSEQVSASFKVLKDKSEKGLVSAAGEAEVAIELYKNQYGVLKERLIRLKTLQKIYSEKLDECYASNNPRQISLYESQLKALNQKVPEAENSLKEFYTIYQTQKQELSLIKESIATHQTMGFAIAPNDLVEDASGRAEQIRALTFRLKERAKRAEALVEVHQSEENFIQ
jgi:hypothetical protein